VVLIVNKNILELVRTETIFDSDSLINILTLIENELEEEFKDNSIDQHPVLLIIDSIAAPLRMSTTSYTRENILLLFTDYAKRFATRYNLLVLVTNQVTTKRRSNILSEKNNENIPLTTNKNLGNDFYMSVALGKAWSYSVNVRLAISYQGDKRRQLIIGKSIESPGYTIGFQILTDGLEEIDDHLNLNTQKKYFEKQKNTTINSS